MPDKGTPAGSTPAGKKQKSIASFFTPKPAVPSSSPLPQRSRPEVGRAKPNSPEPSSKGGDTNAESLLASSDEGEPSRHRSASTQSKRAREDDENDDPDDTSTQAAKRARRQPGSSTSIVPTSHGPITARKTSRVSERTSKYLFNGSSQPASGREGCEEDETQASDDESRRRKEKLHQRFVKKLGRPDSIAEIKRRNRFITEETTVVDEDAENADDGEDGGGGEVTSPPPPKPVAVKGGRRAAGLQKASSKLTPMEKQVLEIKSKHMDTLLVIEVGYKFRFFGEDARIAAKELHIVCIPGKMRYDEHPSEAHIDRFASASIPVHRLHVHVKRLVAAGHKVGVVRQIETAALKAAGDNRNAPFVRRLTNLYTKGTYIDDVESLAGSVDGPSGGAPATGYLLCITETNAKGWGTDEKVHVGIVAVQPATGDVIYDDFEDGFMRSEVETRLLHIAPCEFLIVGQLSKATEKMLQHLSGSSTNVFGDKIRVERVEKPKTMAAQAYSHISNFYAGKMKVSGTAEDEKASNLLEKVLKLSEHVTICLSGMITHMSEYGLEHVFDLTKYFQSFSARSHMLLNGNTLTSLEIYRNQTDNSSKGSLFWALDRTHTRFGQRMLRRWVGRPLLEKTTLEERVDAVEEIISGEKTAMVDKLKGLLSKVKSDLEKSLIRIYYGKCSRPELLTVLQTMQRIANEFAIVKSSSQALFSSEPINRAIAALPVISDDVVSFLERINPEAAKINDKYSFFRENEETDDISEHKLGIASVEQDLDAHRAVAAEKVRKKKVDYVTVAGIEYLIEIENSQVKNVPASWAKISGTKKLSRFHTPEVVQLIRERDQHKEALAAACDAAFASLLADVAAKYQSFRDCIQALATLDCLLSLAEVASQPGYVKPEYTNETCVSVEQGRHPMVEQLLLDSYVPNDIELASDCTRALLITGPNMGGKSSYVRQVALIVIMGQIGSYVPAASAKLGMLDAVFTRMGAFDNMMAGESTFMVELSETSDILKQATPRSLVIMDELGRGTSTHDGVAIAQAVLDYVVRKTKCLCLFITHYQTLSSMAGAYEAGELKNVHMRFTESGQQGHDITFLYEVGEGVAHRSYGLNVARLAYVPDSVLDVAAIKSQELEQSVKSKRLASLSHLLANAHGHDEETLDHLVTGIEQL
ncbi:MAG: Mismatch repair protein msh3 [Thelocarpon impressellum]|nr:MAG: Mismatch repair protein msh3 [Thelocarpon impressellum]